MWYKREIAPKHFSENNVHFSKQMPSMTLPGDLVRSGAAGALRHSCRRWLVAAEVSNSEPVAWKAWVREVTEPDTPGTFAVC